LLREFPGEAGKHPHQEVFSDFVRTLYLEFVLKFVCNQSWWTACP